jgi:hypothetical protein
MVHRTCFNEPDARNCGERLTRHLEFRRPSLIFASEKPYTLWHCEDGMDGTLFRMVDGKVTGYFNKGL